MFPANYIQTVHKRTPGERVDPGGQAAHHPHLRGGARAPHHHQLHPPAVCKCWCLGRHPDVQSG